MFHNLEVTDPDGVTPIRSRHYEIPAVCGVNWLHCESESKTIHPRIS